MSMIRILSKFIRIPFLLKKISAEILFATVFTLISTSTIALAVANDYSTKKITKQVKVMKIKSGETVYSLLKKVGFSQVQTNEVIAQLSQLPKFDLIPNEIYWLITEKGMKQFKFFIPQTDQSLNISLIDNVATAKIIDEKFDVQIKAFSGKINGSILGSIEKLVKDKQVAYRFLDAYRFKYKLRNVVQKNAKFALTLEKKFLLGKFVKHGEILKTQIEIDGNTKTRYFIKTEQGGTFLSASDLQQDRPLFAPVEYIKISSEYQPRRFHPITKRRIPHMGVDFELPKGTPVYTALAGKVLRFGKNRGAGRFVVVQHSNGLESYYNHLSKINENIKTGMQISNGAKIGEIGCSGYCTKPHLHFAIKKGGKFTNPIQFLKTFSFLSQEKIMDKLKKLKQFARN